MMMMLTLDTGWTMLGLVMTVWSMLSVAVHSLLSNVWVAGFAVGACVAMVYEAEHRCYERNLRQREAETLRMRMYIVELKTQAREMTKYMAQGGRPRFGTSGSAKF
jgi:hypothetical protein